MVDTYFEVKNDNQVVVIDDNYRNLSFVHFSDILTVKAEDEIRSGNLDWTKINGGSNGRFRSYSRTYTFQELGLHSYLPGFVGIRRVDGNGAGEFSIAIVEGVLKIPGDYRSEVIGFRYRVNSMVLGAQYQMVCFADLEYRTPSKEGMVIYNAKQELVFDAALGYMQVMDSQYHLRDLYSSAMQSFPVHNSHLPDLDFSRMYLIATQRPYATTGGTIIINNRQYVPRLRKDALNKVYVDLGMWGEIGGNRLQQYQQVFSFMVAYVHF